MPKVSVIIPVYNVEKYLRECLESVISQTLSDIEIICINDGSTDSSLDILNEFAQKDERIKIINQENKGSPLARNEGLKIANGKYIGFVDSDDYIDKNYYELLFNNAEKHNAEIARCSYYYKYKNKEKVCELEQKIKNANEQNKFLGVNDHSVVVFNAIYKYDFLKNNKILFFEDVAAEDIIYTARATFYANKTAPVVGTHYHYRKGVESQLSIINVEKIIRIIYTQKLTINFLNSIESQKNIEDYKIAYKRCIWRYKSLFQKGILMRDFKYQYQVDFLNSYIDAINKYKGNYKELYESDENIRFLLNKEPDKYINAVKKNLKIIDNLIISLTSYPAGIGTVHITIKSLLNQTIKAEKIILWLAEEEFPQKEHDLPKELLDLEKDYLSFEIRWCENIKSYKKLIPTLKAYPNSIIITADDDINYEPNRVELLYKTSKKHPKDVICHQAHYILFDKNKEIKPYKQWLFQYKHEISSHNLLQTGCGMVLYPANCFYTDMLNENLYLSLCDDTDDIWFWAMCLLNGGKIRLAKHHISSLKYIEGTQNVGLYYQNVRREDNDKNLKMMFNYYPQLLKKLSKQKPKHYILQEIFSVTNSSDKQNIILTVFGVKIKIKKVIAIRK